MPRRKKSADVLPDLPDDDKPTRVVPRPVFTMESPNRVVLPRRVNKPRPTDKVGMRPIVL